MITIEPKEINQFRSQFANYPEALIALDIIESNGGSLNDSVLAQVENKDYVVEDYIVTHEMQSKGHLTSYVPKDFEEENYRSNKIKIEPRNILNNLLEKGRDFICQNEIREALESGLISPIVEPLAISLGIPIGTATVVSVCVFKLGAKRFCKVPECNT